MDMSFNWAVDHVLEDVSLIPTIRYDDRLSPWIIAEIQADLIEALGRRLDSAGDPAATR